MLSCIQDRICRLRREGGGLPKSMLTCSASVKDCQGLASWSRNFLCICCMIASRKWTVIGHASKMCASSPSTCPCCVTFKFKVPSPSQAFKFRVCVECLFLRHRGPAPYGAIQRAPLGVGVRESPWSLRVYTGNPQVR